MLQCSFKLNDRPMSEFRIGALAFPAYSGQERYINKVSLTCTPIFGAIPVGQYYIFDRRSGGRLGPWKDALNLNGNNKSEWFALHAIDGNIDDDSVLCNDILRGQFRLHPKGRLGRSEGCITIDQQGDWQHIRSILADIPKGAVPGSELKAYGVVTVA